MKIQCSCGTKYAFDVTSEMATHPVRFVCQACGQDSSEVVNQLIRRELGVQAPAPTPAPAPVSVRPAAGPAPVVVPSAHPRPASTAPAPPAPPSAPPPGAAPTLRVAAHGAAPAGTPAVAVSTGASAGAPAAARACGRHPGEVAAHTCLVCHKPMCPQCMRITGLVCSAFCRTKAESQGIAVPEFAGQRDVVDRRRWRKVGLVTGAIGAVIVAALGFWFWYAWFGCVPKVAYSHRFANPGYSGRLHLSPQQQLIVLHGGTIARHDLASGKIVWSTELIDRDRIARESVTELEEMKKAKEHAVREGADPDGFRLPTLDRLTKDNIRAAAADFDLQVSGDNVWIVSSEKLTRRAWADGRVDKEIPLESDVGEPERVGTELLFRAGTTDDEPVLRVDLASGDFKSNRPAAAGATATARAGAGRPARGATKTTASTGTNAAPTRSRAIDPSAVATRAQNLPLPNRLALPATIAAAENQRRTQALMDEDDAPPPVTARPAARKPGARVYPEVTERHRTSEGTIEFVTKMLEQKIVTREAMKARPKKSALDGPINQAATVDIANELLNEMQRDGEGSTVEEDESRYQVTVRRGGTAAPWTGEVVGSPSLLLLKTVDLVTSGKGLVVLGKDNRKRWEAKLNYPVGAHNTIDDLSDVRPSDEQGLTLGAGPCVERGDTLYVIDQGMLTSFALADGNARWRLPSVGIAGLWFDDAGMLYLNTTTADPDSIRYSKQIDISRKTQSQVLKVDPKSGRTLWTARNEGLITYIWDKYIYVAESYAGDDDDEEAALMGIKTGLEIPAHIRLRRLDAGNGRVLWEHYQPRCPLDVHFDRNTIQFLFKKEVQHLRFVVL